MKIKYLLLFTMLFNISSGILNARKITNKQFALFDYEVIVDDDFRNEIKDLDSYINSIKGYTNKKQDKFEGKIYDITYPYIESMLEKRYEIDILPMNSYMNNIKYNHYGYPNTSVKNAQELGNSHFYLKIKVILSTSTPKGKDAKNSILYKNKTNPVVTIEVEVYEKIGVLPIGKATGLAKVSSPQRIEEAFLKGILKPININEISDLDEYLFAIIYHAIENLVENFDKSI